MTQSGNRELETWIRHVEDLRQRREALLDPEDRRHVARELLIDNETLLAAHTKARTLHAHAAELARTPRLEEALELARQARELAPDESATYLLEAHILLQIATRTRSIANAHLAEVQANRALLIDPASHDAVRVRTNAGALARELTSARRRQLVFAAVTIAAFGILFLLLMTSSETRPTATPPAPIPSPAPETTTLSPAPSPAPLPVHVVRTADGAQVSALTDRLDTTLWTHEASPPPSLLLSSEPAVPIHGLRFVLGADRRNPRAYARPRTLRITLPSGPPIEAELPADPHATQVVHFDAPSTGPIQIDFVERWPGEQRSLRRTYGIAELVPLLEPSPLRAE